MSIGVDIVKVDRFRAMLERAPGLATRFFTETELTYCAATADASLHLAGTFAAKEAVMKTLRLAPAPAWARRIEIVRASDGAPVGRVEGRDIPISISHDAGVAVAVALDLS